MTDDTFTRTARVDTARRIQALAAELVGVAEHAEEASVFPTRSPDGPVSGGDRSDPTGDAAGRQTDWTVADVDSALKKALWLLEKVAAKSRPQRPSAKCACCDTDAATHPRHDDPEWCWPCWRYRDRHDVPCGDDVHEQRGQRVPCQCVDEDCTCYGTCNRDLLAEGRSSGLCGRCRTSRTRRGITQQAGAA